MLRGIVIVAMMVASLQAYDLNRLKINAKVFSKILLLDSGIDEARREGGVVIVYEPSEKKFARLLKEDLGFHLKGFSVSLRPYDKLRPEPAVAWFFLDTPHTERLQTLAKEAAAHGIITYAYTPKYLHDGIMLSLRIEKTVYPELNARMIRKSGIRFQPILFRIAKRFEG